VRLRAIQFRGLPRTDTNNAAEEWKRPPREWVEAKTQFAIVFGERFFNR